MFAMSCRLVIFAVFWISVVSGCTLKGDATNSQTENDRSSNPSASMKANSIKTVRDMTLTPSSLGNPSQLFAQHETRLQESTLPSPKGEAGSQEQNGLEDVTKTLLQIQSAIQALANAHNELLRTISQDKPWWYRNMLLISYSYPESYTAKTEKQFYALLKRFSGDGSLDLSPQSSYQDDKALPEVIQTYLRNLQCQAHHQTIQASPKPYVMFKKEDWRKWKQRLERIKTEVRNSMLKYEFEKQVLVLLKKIDAFQEDFSDQYFRSNVEWIYYYEKSWWNKMFQEVSSLAEKLILTTKSILTSVRSTLAKGKQRLSHEWNSLLISISELNLSAPLEGADHYATEARELLDEFSAELGEAFTDPKDQVVFVRFVLGGVMIYIIATLLTNYLRRQIGDARRQFEIRQEVRRAAVEDTMNISVDANNSSVFARRTPLESWTERNHDTIYPGPAAIQTDAAAANDNPDINVPRISNKQERNPRTSNESAVSCKNASTLSRAKRNEEIIASINAQGPAHKRKAADSIKLGGRKINMVYDTDDGNDDSGAEVVAIVASAKESDIKNPRKPLLKTNVNERGNGSRPRDFDSMAESARQRKVKRILEDSKRILMDASNTSHGSEETRGLKSSSSTASTKSSDALAKRDTKIKSSVPRRRSARLSAANLNRNAG